ncbi:MAG: ribose 5-phosphate isomerase A [Clostridia bacterium]|jgi:ribose 5-phosphate isomerase A|nr:ribose 5-phosphate isomerase A [Clostridia bacterium]
MNWDEKVLQKIEWNGEINNIEQKIKIAKRIASKVKQGDIIGVGSGSTSFITIKEISKRVIEEKLNIIAIPTSHEINLLCLQLGIPTTTLLDKKPDWSFDGADEVNSKNWLIKGRGGAMFREKLNIVNSKQNYILVDETKFVKNICDNFPIPVETYPNAINYVRQELIKMGAESVTLRLAKGKDGPVITEGQNVILDVIFKNVEENLEKNLKNIVGVIETGLFIGYNVTIEK